MLLWTLDEPDRLTEQSRLVMGEADSTLYISIVSLWEIALKQRTGKLTADLAELAAQMAPARSSCSA